jgi:aspartyl protease family protein
MTDFPAWAMQTPLYLIIGGVLLVLLLVRRVPILRTLVTLASWALIAVLLIPLLGQRAQFDPWLGRIAGAMRLDRQEVTGKEVRIPLSRDGHFWARVSMGGVERRMLIDSGATVTAVSVATAAEVGLKPRSGPIPMVLTTANGPVRAEQATVPELKLGNIVARELSVVVSPAFGETNVLGMNFLSRLKSWRVEGNVLILVPNHPQPV